MYVRVRLLAKSMAAVLTMEGDNDEDSGNLERALVGGKGGRLERRCCG